VSTSATAARYDAPVPPVLLRTVELAGTVVDVRVADGAVVEIGGRLPATSDELVVDGDGGRLLAGLHDHHLHVLATAAASASVSVAPDTVPDAAALTRVLRAAATGAPVRAIGYHERTAGMLDRDVLDAMVGDTPVRVQHCTGTLWMLSSAALAGLDPAALADPRVERADDGRATGRIWRGDDLLRSRAAPPDIDAIGAELGRLGVTAITDATATNDATSVAALARLPQRVRVMGPLDLVVADDTGVVLGEVKVLLDDDSLPPLAATIDLVRAAHARARGVAFHCVTLVQLRFAIEVLRVAGVARDRIEHASVAPPDAVADLRALGVTVATQPGFLAVRGDDYLRDVDPRDVPALYPIGSLLAAGVPTLGSTDAPYGPLDPWRAMHAAVDRRAASGAVVGAAERIDERAALALFGGEGAIAPGRPADLVVVDRSREIRLTMIGGRILHRAG
jgi:predicted amidohydrolase YtcJ